MFKERQIEKKYKAIVYKTPRFNSQTIETFTKRDEKNRLKFKVASDGKWAITHYKLEKPLKNASILDIKIDTGRTHQIRVHMSYIGNPIIGDTLYGYKHNYFASPLKDILQDKFLLVAYYLKFYHPKSQKLMEFNIDMPDYFKEATKFLS